MTNFIVDMLDDACRHVEYAVSVDCRKVKIVSHGPDGFDVFAVRATWDGDELDVISIEGDDERLFPERAQRKIESEIGDRTQGTGDEFFESDGGPFDEAYAGQIRDRQRNEAFGRGLNAGHVLKVAL